MKSGQEFLPQYAAQAVLDLEQTAKNFHRAAARGQQGPYLQLAQASEKIAELIRSAVHIVLPDNGEIYRSNSASMACPTLDECASFAGLPAPVSCFEYAYTHDNSDRKSPRRLTLVVDQKQLHDSIPDGFFAPAQIFSVGYSQLHKLWGIATHIMLNAVTPLVAKVQGDTWGIECKVTNLLTLEIDNDPERSLIGEMMPDITAVVQCCHALRAGAHFEERTEGSASRRWKFDKRGVGGFTYHILKLPTGSARQGDATGTHDSPRFHVRRAHIRKLPTGVLTFVRQCFVGDPEKGVVDKHYKVERKA